MLKSKDEQYLLTQIQVPLNKLIALGQGPSHEVVQFYSLGHSNVFIPPTICGSNVDQEKLKTNTSH